MKYPRAPLNRLVVTLEKKMYDSVTFESGITLHFDPTWHPEEYSMLRAKVVSVPKAVSERYDYKGMKCEMQPGDEILVRYDLVFHYKEQPENDTPVYKNMFLLHNPETERMEELWMCDIQKVFAIIRDGRFLMQNGYVYCWPIYETKTFVAPSILNPVHEGHQEVKSIGRIFAIDSDEFTEGDYVYFDPRVVQVYSIDMVTFKIIKTRHILVKS